MRYTAQLALAFLLVVSLPGCLLELLGSAAIQSELAAQSAATGARAMQKAQSHSDQTTLQSAVTAYFAEYGAYPPTLEAVVPQFIDAIPPAPGGGSWAYDATTGSLYVGSGQQASGQPKAIPPATANDRANMKSISEAIYYYGQNTGVYPSQLSDLAPSYIASVPKTDSGRSYEYDPATGQVYHPYDVQQARLQQQQQQQAQQAGGAQRGRAAAAGGPLGEQLTGIHMQQELNSMSQGGVNSAGNRGKANARNIQQQQNDRTNRALRQLDLQ